VTAFSLIGGAIPATLLRTAVDLTPKDGSAPATMGLIQQVFNTGSFAGPAIAAWLATRTGGWQSTWWITCTCAALGSMLSLCLSERRRCDPRGRSPLQGRGLIPAKRASRMRST
jgi:predicted MFS family arabinose efflux permease